MSRRSVVIAGAGDVGGRLAALCAGRGDDVIALRRREQPPSAGIRGLRVDLAGGEGLAQLPRRPDAVVFCAAPDARDEPAYRRLFVDGLRRVLDAVDTPRVIFVSSTAVYGEDAGEWIDELTPAMPPAFNGRILLAAEHELGAHPGGVVLRLSGLYGAGRTMLLRRAREATIARPHWSNRVHVDDAAAALAHLLELRDSATCYLGNDDRPTQEPEILNWLRAREGLPPLSVADAAESGRRVRNRRLRDTGWAPQHSDFRSGYLSLTLPGV